MKGISVVRMDRVFYQYKQGKIISQQLPSGYKAPEDIADRLIFRMINESIACLREQVVTSSDLIDAGLIFGTGFAPFRGGIIHYIKNQNVTNVQAQLNNLQSRHGERFAPDMGWQTQDLLSST